MVIHKYRRPHRIRRKKSPFRSRVFWINFLVLIFLGTIFYFAAFSQLFQIKKFSISGNQKIQSHELETFVREEIDQKILFIHTESIFFINSGEIIGSILEKFPQAEEIKLRRKLPTTLIIEVKERSPIGIFCQDYNPPTTLPAEDGAPEKCFFFDKNGVIFEETSQNHELIIKFQEKKESITLGQKIIEKEQIQSILKIYEKLKTGLKIVVKEFFITDKERVNVKTTDGWEVYFGLKGDIDWQLTKLSLVLEKEIPPEKRGELEYIDLRFGNLAPYKYRIPPPPTEESP